MGSAVSRRSFLSGVAASSSAALSAASYGQVVGANERIRVGCIGYGLIGKRHVIDFRGEPDVDVVALSEAHQGRLDEAAAFVGGAVKTYPDFRQLLDHPNLDAVVISTPDHWHALMTMMACAAGKDVYVEKPLTVFTREGRWMVDVARRERRVVQIGTQQRSGPHYARARQLIRDGHLGKVVSVSARHYRNIMPGYGAPPDQDAPPELDWDMWLGPAPRRPYNPNRAIYHFRWFWDYSGGQMTNIGQHAFDIVDWTLGIGALKAVSSGGGRFCLEDIGETPDTQDALFEFGDWTATWSAREGSRGQSRPYGLEFHGTQGTLGISRRGFTVTADPDIPPPNTVPQFTGAHPVGGPQPVPVTGGAKLRTRGLSDRSGDDRAQFKLHVRNFLDCIKSRENPVSDLESGHRVATMCHLANLSLRLGRKLKWDSAGESVVDDPEANSLLVRPYRSPWDKELTGLLS